MEHLFYETIAHLKIRIDLSLLKLKIHFCQMSKVVKINQCLPWNSIFLISYNASKIALGGGQNQNNLLFRSRVNKLGLIQFHC